jgi:ABC-type Zn uptake system ZnuABC Zn-binding protein ZnuA
MSAGTKVDVATLVGSNGDVHVYSPTPAAVRIALTDPLFAYVGIANRNEAAMSI